MRIGIGYDVHRLAAGRPLIIGGVEIPHTHGLEGHSDADVLIHAIIDAILGALAWGDIGRWFPDTDPQWKGISSLELLEKVQHRLENQNWRVCNLDTVIVAQEPKLKPFLESMREAISQVLQIDLQDISIKATTTEGLGFSGRKEGIAAQAVVLVEKRPSRAHGEEEVDEQF